MLSCVCSVINHRSSSSSFMWCVVITRKWDTRRKSSVSLMFLPHFDVFCDLLLNRCYLFYIITKQITTLKAFIYFKILQHYAKAGLSPPLPTWASRGMKTYSESRFELRNLKILKKMLEKSRQFLSSAQPCEPN